MKLRCWPGCTARVSKSIHNNYGMIVTCVRLVGQLSDRFHDGNWWEIDTPLTFTDGKKYCYALDEWLTPLKNDEGEDEMLRIAGKPKKVKVTIKRPKELVYVDKKKES